MARLLDPEAIEGRLFKMLVTFARSGKPTERFDIDAPDTRDAYRQAQARHPEGHVFCFNGGAWSERGEEG